MIVGKQENQTIFRNEDGKVIRKINNISKLVDASSVTRAAYPGTQVWARHLEEFVAEEKEKVEESIKTDLENYRELKLKKLKLYK